MRFLCILLLICTLNAPATAQDEGGGRLSVTGHGVTQGVPDRAQIRFGVRQDAKTAKAASAAMAGALASVMKKLVAAGIDKADVQTTHLSLSPQLDHSGSGAPKQLGFSASSDLTVQINDLAKLGGVLDKVVEAGVNDFGGVSFDLSNRDELLDQARRAAVENAMHTAKVLAEAAGLGVGPIVSIQHISSTHPLVPMGRMAMAAKSDMPIAAGTLDVSTQVTIVFELLILG